MSTITIIVKIRKSLGGQSGSDGAPNNTIAVQSFLEGGYPEGSIATVTPSLITMETGVEECLNVPVDYSTYSCTYGELLPALPYFCYSTIQYIVEIFLR